MAREATLTPFFYFAARPGGGRSMGVRTARSRRSLGDQLRRDRLVVLNAWALPGFLASERGLSTKDHEALNNQLSQLLSRGVPLVEALEVAGSLVHEAARPRIDRLRERVRAGSSFADACAQGGSFDAVTVAVYRAAERTGDLHGAAAQLARSAKRMLAIRGKAVTLMIYPAIVLTITILVAFVMLTVIVPMIGGALRQSGRELPGVTEFMMTLGVFLRGNLIAVFIAVALAGAAGVVFRAGLARSMFGLMRRLPRVKNVVRAQELARFFGVMAAMTRSGVALGDALGVATTAVHDPRIRTDLDRLRQKLIEGGVLRALLERVESLPLATRKLLVAADQAGDLSSAFDALAQDYTDEVDTQTERLLAALEPALIVLMFAVIGSMILAIMAPLLSITSQGFG
ncbi:MAG: type II secretion system F family protein [Planctomycetota bacterium]